MNEIYTQIDLKDLVCVCVCMHVLPVGKLAVSNESKPPLNTRDDIIGKDRHNLN